MPSTAPHLPPKVYDAKALEQRERLPLLAFLVAFAMLAGFTSALVTVAWIAPPLVTESVLTWPGGARGSGNGLNPTVINESKKRLISLFDSSKKITGTIYPAKALGGHAVLLSSDGWAVMHASAYRAGREKNWEGIDYQGIVHKVEKVVEDTIAHLVYLKFDGEGFHIAPFAYWDAIDSGYSLWSLAGRMMPLRQTDWRPIIVGDPAAVNDAAQPIWRPVYFYRLEPKPEVGSIIFNDRGALAGFADDKGSLIGGWLIESQLSNVLASTPLRYDKLNLEGRMVSGIAVRSVVKPMIGWLVTKASRLADKPSVKAGDIIIRIGNHPAGPVTLSRDIMLASAEFNLTVWRDGQEKEITVKKSR